MRSRLRKRAEAALMVTEWLDRLDDFSLLGGPVAPGIFVASSSARHRVAAAIAHGLRPRRKDIRYLENLGSPGGLPVPPIPEKRP